VSGRQLHEQTQARHWSRPRPDHYRWKTETPLFSESERALVAGVSAEGAVLEIGCGEGANLHHADARGPRHAMDRSAAKVAFAARAVPGVRGVVADAARLPYADACFEAVLIRDLLHHVYDRETVLNEAWRVLRPGGTLHVVEANGRNPIFLAQALLVPAERGLLHSTPARLRSELERLAGADVQVDMAQPLPVARLLLHPDHGRPSLAEARAVRRGLSLFDRCARVLPQRTWGYIRARARKPAHA
jgi:SAM-dependent methyltransferase